MWTTLKFLGYGEKAYSKLTPKGIEELLKLSSDVVEAQV